MVKAVTETSAFGKMVEPRKGSAAICACGYCWDQAILREREIWNEVMELEHEAYLMTEKAEAVAVALHLDAIHHDGSMIRIVERAEQMKQRALAAS
jgi:hypothetical protein